MKIPEPTMPPMTSMVASNKPSFRARAGLESACAIRAGRLSHEGGLALAPLFQCAGQRAWSTLANTACQQ